MTREFLRYYKHTFDLDGEAVTVHIKRMTFEEWQDFSGRSAELEKTMYEQRIYRKEGAEQELDEKGQFKMSFEEVCQRRIAQMSEEERAEIEAAQNAKLKELTEFMADSITQFIIHVEPGLVDIDSDGSKHPVANGAQLLDIIGARTDLHNYLYQAIYAENNFDAQKKIAWRSVAGFSSSSREPKKDQAGRKRKTTAGSAGTSDSAGNGAAKHRRNGRSGSEGQKRRQSSSTVVPS